MELLIVGVIGLLVILFLIVRLVIRRIRTVVSWPALRMTALATGSPRACVALIRFCARQ
jgi:hypothetical protein